VRPLASEVVQLASVAMRARPPSGVRRAEDGRRQAAARRAGLEGVELAEVIDRASNRYDRWAEQVAQAGYCAHPIRLAGRVEQADRATGELRETYSTEAEPDGTLLKACGTRRASRCPSCAAVYQADAYQLTAAGLQGGKGVPETVAEHPRLFVTFTAPSFGRVHTPQDPGPAGAALPPTSARPGVPARSAGRLLDPPPGRRPGPGRANLPAVL
jgi:hypothetical protein